MEVVFSKLIWSQYMLIGSITDSFNLEVPAISGQRVRKEK